MQEKRIDERHQPNQSSPLNIGSLAEEIVEKLGNNTTIQIVYFDEMAKMPETHYGFICKVASMA